MRRRAVLQGLAGAAAVGALGWGELHGGFTPDCVAQRELASHRFRSSERVISESTLPAATRRTDAHVVYREEATEEFAFDAMPDDAAAFVRETDLAGDLWPVVGDDTHQDTLYLLQARLYDRDGRLRLGCVQKEGFKRDAVTVHAGIVEPSPLDDGTGGGADGTGGGDGGAAGGGDPFAYEHLLVRVPGTVPVFPRARFALERDGDVVNAWMEDATPHG